MRRALAGVVGAAVLVAVVALLERHALLQAAGDFLVVTDALRPADAVIAISGNNPERMRTAGRLVRDGYAPRVIVSGPPGVAQEMVEMGIDEGIPPDRILVDEGPTSTWENALGAAGVMRQAGLHSAILVTSPYHMRRAIILFRRAFHAAGLTVSAYSVPDSIIDLRRWWERPRDREFVVREWTKLAALALGIR